MYNTTTKSFTLADASDSYHWIIESLDSADYANFSDSDINEWIDELIDTAISQEEYEIEQRASELSYPVWGYTTAQQFEDEDEYIEFKKQELRDDLVAERDTVFQYLKDWIAAAPTGGGNMDAAQQHEVWFSIPAVYNPGEWRLSKQVVGPRGGQKWQRLTHGIAATGGSQQMFLVPGRYKETWWTNNWPNKVEFIITDDGDVVYLDA